MLQWMPLGNPMGKIHKIHKNDDLNKDFKNMLIRYKNFGKRKKIPSQKDF